MNRLILSGIVIILAFFILITGCTEPPVKEPAVTVSDIELSEVTLQAMRVNATVIIFNPNPLGAKLKSVAFDVWYIDDTENYLGHGEQSGIDVASNGNTTLSIPVTIGNIQAIKAAATLIRKGSLTLKVNGSALIDVGVISFEKRFEQDRQFQVRDFGSIVQATPV
jgi:LEA14-like dessication related protein